MTFQAGRQKTGGRQVGTTNKSTKELKEMILLTLQDKGGIEYLKQLPDNLFVQLLLRILPRNLSQEAEDNEAVKIYIQGVSDPESIKRREALDYKAKFEAYKKQVPC